MKIYNGYVNELKENEIFVFGSNPLGINGGGAALVASKNGWCRRDEPMDNRLSDCGKSYGLTTVKYPGGKNTYTLNKIRSNVNLLYKTANENTDKQFLVAYTAGGRNLNGWTDVEMASGFASKNIPDNIVFESGFAKLVEDLL